MHESDKRHNEALYATRVATSARDKHESAYITLYIGWVAYADAYRKRYESTIGDDPMFAPQWLAIGRSLIGMLNAETGRIDCATMDADVRRIMVENGIAPETVDTL